MSELAPMDVRARLDRLRGGFDSAGLEALVLTHLTNIRYLSGFSGSAGILVVESNRATLVTDGRYGDQAPAQLAAAGVDVGVEVTSDAQKEVVAGLLAGVVRIGLEAEHVSWAARNRYAEEWFPKAELVAASGLVERLREVKDPGEIDRIRAACTLADSALAEIRHRLGEAPTEREFAGELDFAMRRLGASASSFPTIVASGPNGALPHSRPTDRRIVEGDLVVIDFGAVVEGYCSDMTRTIMVGEPSPTQERMLAVVGEAQAAGIAAMSAGVAARDVDSACREVVEAAGWGEAFTHGTGHGVGLDIHEAPRVARTSGDTLAAGQVVTVEPGVYLQAHGGVRIEDTVVVTDAGAETLTLTPKLSSVA